MAHVDEPEQATPVFVISVAAELAGLHPQTLRQYDRLGLVSPGRTPGRGRRYSARDIAALRQVQRLTAEGINLAGVKRILELERSLLALQDRLAELLAAADSPERDRNPAAPAMVPAVESSPYLPARLPLPGSTAVVLWRPRRATGRRVGR